MKSAPLLPGATLGMLGSGQLGRMFAIAARQMGYRVHVFSPDADSPTGQIADREVSALYDDGEAVREFARRVGAVSFEFENVPSTAVAHVEAEGVPVRPGADVLHVTQNRLREKSFVRSLGIATPDFAAVTSPETLDAALATIGVPAVLKTAGSGYDGKGQRVLRRADEARPAWEALGRVECILEGFVEFAFEGSVVAARGADGTYADYGLVRNEHANHILDVTQAPAPGVPPALAAEASETARAILERLGVVGVLCVEFFVTTGGKLLVNEMAPRPHNSGHYTIDACVTSQFEQQVRTLCGLPLGSPAMLRPGAAMANLLGDLWQNGEPDWAGMLAAFPDVNLHLYGKRDAKPGRKMGHLAAAADTPEQAAERVRAARAALTAR
ncbi:MAG TPA: 5-(carboxyamino)imidazole ribonucleotide synthase [Armatimonadaceae bacterium]|nr:5-(carboxyamino)imidazole ribonucleotide synthase [Armatimonadaceae bacterium]